MTKPEIFGIAPLFIMKNVPAARRCSCSRTSGGSTRDEVIAAAGGAGYDLSPHLPR